MWKRAGILAGLTTAPLILTHLVGPLRDCTFAFRWAMDHRIQPAVPCALTRDGLPALLLLGAYFFLAALGATLLTRRLRARELVLGGLAAVLTQQTLWLHDLGWSPALLLSGNLRLLRDGPALAVPAGLFQLAFVGLALGALFAGAAAARRLRQLVTARRICPGCAAVLAREEAERCPACGAALQRRSLWRRFWIGPAAGALLMLALYAHDLHGAVGELMGFSDQRVLPSGLWHYRAYGFLQQVTIGLTLGLLGAAFGSIGAGIGRLWSWAADRPARLGVLWGALTALLLHGYLLLQHIATYPQLYQHHLYDRGGWRREAMIFITDDLPLWTLHLGLGLLLAALLIFPLLSRRGRALASRLGSGLRRRPRTSIAAGAGLTLVLAAAVLVLTHHPRASASTGRPNLLLIAVDGLRPDRVLTAAAQRRFPNLARLVRRGVRFQQAHVTLARTFPAVVTLLTGRYPHHHGIRHMFPSAAQRRAIGPTLPKLLHKAGWRTAAVADYAGEIFTRTPLGFELVDAPRFDLHAIVQQRSVMGHLNVLPYATSRPGFAIFPYMRATAELNDPDRLTDRALSALDQLADRPFMLTLFYSATHFPYVGPRPYFRRFTDPAYRGPYRYLKQPLPLLPSLPAADAAQIRALYDGAVLAVDAALGRLLEHLDRLGLTRNTVIVLLADHGENLFDVPGRGQGHGAHLEGPLANHIPLVIVDPRTAGRDVPGIVRDVDLAPTLARLLGVAPPPGDGVDLAPLLRGEKPSLGLSAYAETGVWFLQHGPGYERGKRLPYPDIFHTTTIADDGDIYIAPRWNPRIVRAKHRAIRTPRWKLVRRPTPGGVRWLLYDLQDPRELSDVAAAHPDVVQSLGRRLTAWMAPDLERTQSASAPAAPP